MKADKLTTGVLGLTVPFQNEASKMSFGVG